MANNVANVNVKAEDLQKLIKDVELIKEILLEEAGEKELTEWARKELEEARARKVKISHDEVRRRILSK